MNTRPHTRIGPAAAAAAAASAQLLLDVAGFATLC